METKRVGQQPASIPHASGIRVTLREVVDSMTLREIVGSIDGFTWFVLGVVAGLMLSAVVMRMALADYCVSPKGVEVCRQFVKSAMKSPQ